MMNARQVPLALAHENAKMAVTGVAGTRETQKRLTEMGIFVGSELEVVRGCGHGPVVVAVGKTRLALGQDMCRRIFVTPILNR